MFECSAKYSAKITNMSYNHVWNFKIILFWCGHNFFGIQQKRFLKGLRLIIF